MTAEKVGVLIEESKDVVVKGTAGPASVGKGELTRGEAPAGIVIWKLWGVGGVSGAGVAALLLLNGDEKSSLAIGVLELAVDNGGAT